MKIIQDIRLFCSEISNTIGNPQPTYFADKKLIAITQRIVMKLREQGFSLGEFTHLYVNFTTCPVDHQMAPAALPVDSYHPWYRFYDIQVSHEFFMQLSEEALIPEIIQYIETLLIRFFSTEEFPKAKLQECISIALTQGESMLMKFKEKISASRRAVIYLKFSDTCCYTPLLEVFDKEDNLLLQKDLPEMILFDALGEIQLSSKKITIKPRKNVFAQELTPMTFELPH